jgi:hypothetical protein
MNTYIRVPDGAFVAQTLLTHKRCSYEFLRGPGIFGTVLDKAYKCYQILRMIRLRKHSHYDSSKWQIKEQPSSRCMKPHEPRLLAEHEKGPQNLPTRTKQNESELELQKFPQRTYHSNHYANKIALYFPFPERAP